MNGPLPLTVVTVTYGDRWHLLQRVVREVRDQGVARLVLVDNAAILPLAEIAAEFGDLVTLVHLPHNSGSASGFKAGIEQALALDAEYILLLDDDNLPAPGSLAKLIGAWSACARDCRGPVALVGNRSHATPGRHDDLASKKVRLRPGSFMSFHATDLPSKLYKRLRARLLPPAAPALPGLVPVEVCTYGGLLLHRSTIEAVGLPREDFVLYVDDYELSYRISSRGGAITLVTDARIYDLDLQWNAGVRFSNTFKAWLLGEGDLRAYYTTRNLCYFERHLQRHCALARRINKALYLAILRYYAWRLHRRDRLALLLQAMRDGENAQMGVCPRHPL
jgi:GT2 family glycosyltransferase